MNSEDSAAMTVLGIDPGSIRTGYAFLRKEGNGIRALSYGVIRCRPSDTLSSRLYHIIQTLESLIVQHAPRKMIIESAFMAKNVHSALVLGHVRGALMVLGQQHDLEYLEISPRKVKQSITGNGASGKEQVARFVMQLLRLESLEGPSDVSDALAIAWCAIHASSFMPPPSEPARRLNPPLPAHTIKNPHIATALPPGIDPQAFLQAHRSKKKRR